MKTKKESKGNNKNCKSAGEKGIYRKKQLGIWLIVLCIIGILLLIFLWKKNEKDYDFNWNREYEQSTEEKEVGTEQEVPRIFIGVDNNYVICDEEPYFYIGYPKKNEFDAKLEILDENEKLLYETKYITPNSNVKIDGTSFAAHGKHTYFCKVKIYENDSEELINDALIMKINIDYDGEN